MKVTAINTIHTRPDPKGPVVVQEPNSEFELAKADEWMLAAGAVRKVEAPPPAAPVAKDAAPPPKFGGGKA